MNIFLWILAFLGIILIYSSKGIVRLAHISEKSEAAVIAVKFIGIAVSVIAMLLLYKFKMLI